MLSEETWIDEYGYKAIVNYDENGNVLVDGDTLRAMMTALGFNLVEDDEDDD